MLISLSEVLIGLEIIMSTTDSCLQTMDKKKRETFFAAAMAMLMHMQLGIVPKNKHTDWMIKQKPY